MKPFLRVGVVSAVLSLAVLAGGCAEDNEKSANITGKAPENAPTSQGDMQAQMKGSGGGMPKTYPGAANKK